MASDSGGTGERDRVVRSFQGVVGSVVSVVDRYISFVCLSPFEFSLHRPRSFCITHGSFPDRVVEQTINDISMGVFCVLATLGKCIEVYKLNSSTV